MRESETQIERNATRRGGAGKGFEDYACIAMAGAYIAKKSPPLLYRPAESKLPLYRLSATYFSPRRGNAPPPELASGAAPCKPTPQTTWVAAASGGLSRFIGPSTTVHVGWLLCVGKRGMSPMDAAVRVLGGAVFLGTPSGASSGAFPTTA